MQNIIRKVLLKKLIEHVTYNIIFEFTCRLNIHITQMLDLFHFHISCIFQPRFFSK